MKKEKNFGDTELGQGLGCTAVILAISLGIGLLVYLSKSIIPS